MKSEFWVNVWNEGKINFHQKDFEEKLLEYFPNLSPKAGQLVLVPLCGKSKDLVWLTQLGLNVQGVELHEAAVRAFFDENDLTSYKKHQDHDFIQYSVENLKISCGDFFSFKKFNLYNFVYDRAALVAMPKEMRKQYAEVITKTLRVGGKYLLITYEYDQSKLDGPPFSVDSDEVHELYQDHFSIKQMESKELKREGTKFSNLESFKEVVYVLEKTS